MEEETDHSPPSQFDKIRAKVLPDFVTVVGYKFVTVVGKEARFTQLITYDGNRYIVDDYQTWKDIEVGKDYWVYISKTTGHVIEVYFEQK